MSADRGLSGRTAVLKWSYYTAAKIEGYSVTRDNRKAWAASGFFLPGAVDAFKVAQRPLYLVAPFKGGAWIWEVERLTLLDGGRFVASLGPLRVEKKPHVGTSTTPGNRHDPVIAGRFDRR